MRGREKKKLETLRLITAAIKQIEVDERIEVDEPRLLTILEKMVKQRKESIAQFESAGRNDLVEQEVFELDLINHYMPEPLSEQEILSLIDKAMSETQAGKMSDMGKVVAFVKPHMLGRADMSKVSALIKTKLS